MEKNCEQSYISASSFLAYLASFVQLVEEGNLNLETSRCLVVALQSA